MEQTQTDTIKEYILVRERTAPPASFKHLPAQPLPVYSNYVPDCLTEQAGGEVGWANFWKRQGGVSFLSLIYILWFIPYDTNKRDLVATAGWQSRLLI